MSRYGKYFLQHLLWLEDDFCHYYVQDDSWGLQDILDAECVVFEFREDAEYWIIQCAKWDPHMTLRSLRNFLAKDSLSQYQVHRRNDRQVIRAAARELSMNACRMVIEPKIGWAVQVDQDTREPVQPIAVDAAPELGGLLSELKVHLNAIVVDRQHQTDQLNAKLAEMNALERSWELNKRRMRSSFKYMQLKNAVDAIRAIPGTAKTAGKVLATAGNLFEAMVDSIRAGSLEPIHHEVEQAISPLVETTEQAKQASAMAQVLLNDEATFAVFREFGDNYMDAMHSLDKMEYGLKTISVVIGLIGSIVAMIYTGGTSAAGTAGSMIANINRLRKAAPVVDKIFKVLKSIGDRVHLPKAIEKVSNTAKKMSKKKGKGGVPDVKQPEKIDNNGKKGYSSNNKDDGPKTTGPKNFKIDKNKHKYFFGEVEPPSSSLKNTNPKKYKKLKHNYDRSQQIKKELEKVGIKNNDAGRKKLLDIFDKAAENPPINKHEGPFGTTLTKATKYKGTKFEVKYFYEAGNMAKKPKVVSLIPKS